MPENFKGATPDDWKTVADITADAFRDDPVTRWVFGTPNGIRSAFRVFARTLYCKHGISYLADGNTGATMWLHPAYQAIWISARNCSLQQVFYGMAAKVRSNAPP